MRKLIKKKIIRLLELVSKGVQEISAKKSAVLMLEEVQYALSLIKALLCDTPDYLDKTEDLEVQFSYIVNLVLQGEVAKDQIQEFVSEVNKLQATLEKEAEKSLVVFLPYKASMWDSMESIWMAAKDDEACETMVLPIPYYERTVNGELGAFHYEGLQFPDYVSVYDYAEVDLKELQPEIVYIHNPYDEYNNVTSVHPNFYSDKLKEYTKTLVYVPYFIPGSYASLDDGASFCCTKGSMNADVVIAQSEVHKKMLVHHGKSPKKIAVLGNPKLEYVQNHLEDTVIPEGWKQKIGGRDAVLVCMSVGSFLAWEQYDCIEWYDRIIETIMTEYGKAVIFRPHPLLESTISSMRPWRQEEYQNFLNKYRDRDGFVLDTLPDTMPAIKASYCMFSDYSSLCFSYMVTGKPVGIIVCGYDERVKNYLYALDYRECYFVDITFWRGKEAPITEEYWTQEALHIIQTEFAGILDKELILKHIFRKYISDVLHGNDKNQKRRMTCFYDSIMNGRGGCGIAIHNNIIMAQCESC